MSIQEKVESFRKWLGAVKTKISKMLHTWYEQFTAWNTRSDSGDTAAAHDADAAHDQRTDDGTTGTTETSSSAQADNRTAKTAAQPMAVFSNVADFLASLCFIALVVIAVKPQLLAVYTPHPESGSEIPKYIVMTKKIGTILFRFEATGTISSDLAICRSIFVVSFILITFIFKIIAIVLSQDTTKKIVPLLLVVIEIFACFLLPYNFILFIVFVLLLYSTFEIAIGCSKKIVIRKLVILAIVGIIGYVYAHIMLIPSVLPVVKSIGAGFKIVGENIVAFFRLLRFPIRIR
ncbi:MAG: hypothetical protein IJ191_06895 [Treponema sp.]|nr:hypothetical protein [Treponema sp.]